MTTLLIYSALLLLAVLFSDLARRSVLSISVLFLAGGFVAGLSGIMVADPQVKTVRFFSDLALISVLFTDGTRVGMRDLFRAWRLPGRALLLGMPLTCAGTAALAHWVAGVEWLHAFLIGAVLSPTDPVFASALVGNRKIPPQLRYLLNVESGMNDGLALPAVLILLSLLGARQAQFPTVLGDVALGVVLGISIPVLAAYVERTRLFSVSERYQPLFGVAVFLLVWSLASLTRGNEFLASFVAGVVIASLSQSLRNRFTGFGETASEMIKLGALLLFGALIHVDWLLELRWNGYLFAILTLLLVRPIALMLALLGSALPFRQRLVVAWFGPKGFASVVFGLMILNSSLPNKLHTFHLIALVVTASILVHSTTDVIAAKWLNSGGGEDEREFQSQASSVSQRTDASAEAVEEQEPELVRS